MPTSRSEAGKLGSIKSQAAHQEAFQARLAAYNENPKRCRFCQEPFAYEKRRNNFCNQSCAAKFNNRLGVIPKRKRVHQTECSNCERRLGPKQIKFCSSDCSNAFRRKATDASIERGEKVGPLRLKRYLIERLGNRCLSPNCAWDFDRLPICVELEHKDGNSENNDFGNLTLYCPNCHSLTPTYKARNRGNGRAYRRIRYAEGKSY